MKPIVYIIDADYNICRDLKILLENASLNVYSFPCPGLACDTITQHSPDALIIDIAFANCNVTSFDAVSEIQLLTGTKIPVVFISSRSDLVARTRAMRSGADAFFCKPITTINWRTPIAVGFQPVAGWVMPHNVSNHCTKKGTKIQRGSQSDHPSARLSIRLKDVYCNARFPIFHISLLSGT